MTTTTTPLMTLSNLPAGHDIRPEWQVHQLVGSGWVHPSLVTVGLRIAYPRNWALRGFSEGEWFVPEWTVGRVTAIHNGVMSITFEDGTGVQCGIEAYAHFCLHVPEKWPSRTPGARKSRCKTCGEFTGHVDGCPGRDR